MTTRWVRSTSGTALVLVLAFTGYGGRLLAQSTNPPADDESNVNSSSDVEEIFRPPMADQTEPANRVRYGGKEIDFGMALPFPVYTSESSGSSWQVGFLGGIVAGFGSARTTLLLKAADFHAGIPVSYRKGKWSTRVEFYHVSSHLGTDYESSFPYPLFHYSREEIEDLVSYDASKHFRVYGGPRFLVRTFPHVGRWTLQAGTEWFPARLEYQHARFYLADDYQARQEVGWKPNLSVNPGVQFRTRKGVPVARLEGWYYSGQDPFGQLYLLRERIAGAQFIFDVPPLLKSLVTRRH